MTRNWRVDEEALIPNWKGFELFRAPRLSAPLFLPPRSLELDNRLLDQRGVGRAKKSDNVLSRRCDLTSDFGRRAGILLPRSFLGVRCSKLRASSGLRMGLGFKESPLSLPRSLEALLSADADPALLLLPAPPCCLGLSNSSCRFPLSL